MALQQIQYLRSTCSVIVLVVCGMATGNLDGAQVLQAFFGLRPSLSPPRNCDARKAFKSLEKRQPYIIHRIRLLRTLIIDEFFMLTAQWFDFLFELFAIVRNEYIKPFGGIQVIGIGDPFQLPPIPGSKKESPMTPEEQEIALRESFVFRAKHFSEVFDYETIEELSVSIRQQTDSSFVNLLNRLKVGEITDEDRVVLAERQLEALNADEKKEYNLSKIWIPHLFCTNIKVHNCNQTQLQQVLANLPDEHSQIEPKTAKEETIPWTEKYLKYYELCKKKYAKMVTFTKKDRYGIYTQRAKPQIQKFLMRFGHMHKTEKNAALELSQSCSKKIEIEAFLLPGVVIVLTKNLDVSKGLYHGKVGTIVSVEDDSVSSSEKHCPLIRWQDDEGKIPLPPLYKLERYTWTVPFSEGRMSYSHFPVNYAWAFNSHKYQGKTAKLGIVADLSDVFTWGQAYSMITRVKCLKDLKLSGMLKDKAKLCHPDVLKFVKKVAAEKLKKNELLFYSLRLR